MANEKPIGIALIVCDQIVVDDSTDKRSLFGLFNSVRSSSFPITLTHLSVFASITNINGNVRLELKCVDETHSDPLLAVPCNASSNNPCNVLDIAFDFDNFSFPRPGLYCFEIQWEEEIILSTRFNVLRLSTE